MKILALDLALAKSGFAVATDGAPEACGVWKTPTNKDFKEQRAKIEFMRRHVATMLRFVQPDAVIIEVCAPQRNAEVFRALVRVEAVCGQEATDLGIPVLLVRVNSVREIAFGDGKTGKDTAYRKMVEQWPQFDWKPQEKGGDDMSDALAMAITGPKLFDRQ